LVDALYAYTLLLTVLLAGELLIYPPIKNIWAPTVAYPIELFGVIPAGGERWKDTTASRVDIAWDTDVDMSDACRSYFKLNRDNVPTPLLYESRNGGMTLYIGAPSSDKRVRVYNKAAEQDLEGLVWWRYELQLRGRYAKAAWLSHFNDYPKAGASEALWNVGRFGKDVGKVFPRPISLHGGAKWAWDVVLPALSNLIVDGEVSMDTFISNLRDDVARRRLLKNS
jgi:hypothetical protein